jgi:DNA polymerase (family 10)
MTNLEMANRLRDLRDFLIIAGYEESHATRYTQIARTIEKMPEPIMELHVEHRLTEIPQVGKLIAQYMKEIIRDGVSSKQLEWEKEAPISVLELVRVPGLGAKTARRLWQEHQISTLAQLQKTVQEQDLPGIGPKMKQAILETTL